MEFLIQNIHGFKSWQAEETSRVFDARLINQIIPLVDGLTDKRRSGIDVLDVGCGRGHAINIMAKTFPNSRFVGYDISNEAIEAAKKEAEGIEGEGIALKNVLFETRDIASLNEFEKYDLITAFDTIHDQAQPTKVLRKIYNALKRDNNNLSSRGADNYGIFLMQDIAASSYLQENIDNTLGPTLYAFSTMHCLTVSFAYNGEGLGTVWGRQKAEQKLKEAGFAGKIDVKQVAGDILNYYYVARKK